jgi:hypothetical protein
MAVFGISVVKPLCSTKELLISVSCSVLANEFNERAVESV